MTNQPPIIPAASPAFPVPPVITQKPSATPPPLPAATGAPGAPARPAFRFRKRYALALLVLGVPLLCGFGVTGYFRLSSETKALRGSLMNAIPGQWNKRFAVHVGGLTMATVRGVSRYFKLPPEPRAALDALHGAEVGVYRLQDAPGTVDYPALFKAADKAMKWRGWERVVGVAQGCKCVAVYIPHKGVSADNMACCVLVLDERDLVVASARGNLEPLLEIASKHLEHERGWRVGKWKELAGTP